MATALATFAVAVSAFAIGDHLGTSNRDNQTPKPSGLTPYGSLLDPGGLAAEDVAFNSDGKNLAVSHGDGVVQVWELADITVLAAFVVPGGRSLDPVAFSPDSRTLATGGSNGELELWNLVTHKLSFSSRCPSSDGIRDITFSPDGKLLVAGGSGHNLICVLNVKTRTVTKIDFDHAGEITSLAFSPDGRTLVAGSSGGILVSLALRAHSKSISFGRRSTFPAQHRGSITSVAFSPDGGLLAFGDLQGSAYLLDSVTGNLEGPGMSDPGKSDGVSEVAFSPDGSTLAVADADGTSYLRDVNSRKLIAAFPDPTSMGINAAAFSPDGHVLAVADRNGTTYLWHPHQPAEQNPPQAGSTAQSEATGVSNLLMSSANARSQWDAQTLVNDTGSCVDINADVNQIEDIASTRSSELNRVQTLKFDKLPNGATLKSQLMTALQISLQIDNDYLNWAKQQQSSGCAYGFNNTYYNDATAQDNAAAADKQAFLNNWDPIASQYGLEQFSAGQI